MPLDGRDYKTTHTAASRPLKQLCSRGNPSQDYRAVAARHTRPSPQLLAPQFAHIRTYPRLSISALVASRDEMRRPQTRPRP